uniref:Uncharacterized protein n=1 Tax=Physcomitrium patens TaxID=3218 RepID=A0A2K1I9Q6_PHYPA|nr:hypothetical protein PHYPA_031220 [Physcomitrium patens]
MYDALGVSLQAAPLHMLNQIVFEIPPEHPLLDSRPLKEVFGYTPP